MARIGRLAGALLLETESQFYLLGNLKEPCHFNAAGFEIPPCEIDGVTRPYVRLGQCGPVTLSTPQLTCSVEGEEVARALCARLLILRNGSVSERLWNLITDPEQTGGAAAQVDVNWLVRMPQPVWDIVRDTVLRCS